MADNSPSSGGSGDIIATDELTTINGAAASGFKVQRVKVGYGADGDFNDVSARQGLPITSTPAEDPLGLPTYDDTVASLIAGNSVSRDQRSLLDVLDPLSDNYVAPQAEMLGSQGRVFDQLPEGGIRTGLTTRNYRGFSNTVGTVMVTPVFCGDMNSFSVVWRSAAAVQIDVQIMLPDGSWASVWGNFAGQTISVGSTGGPSSSSGQPAFFSGLLYGAQYVRLVHLSAAGTLHALMQLSNGPPATFQIAGAVTVQQGTAGNLQCTANIATTTTVATTNGQTLNQQIITATTPAAVQVKASAGRITMLQISNGAANVGYLHLQNNAAAASNTASVMTFAIPATAGANISIALPEGGLYMSSGIAYTVSGAIASGDTTVLTAPSIAVNISYI